MAQAFRPAIVAGLYLLIALIFTWPLLLGLTRNIPWDLGDSLLNCWILAWDADHVRQFLSGNVHALSGFWNANIFYPEPMTLAYSEHLFAQAIQILPVYWVTHNIILCYNLLFLSTFVLSGLGTFLFVREVTGSRSAAFVAGVIYAFAPMRVTQFSHLQVISSQWMPFTLYGLRRYFDTRRIKPLAGAGLALVAQNLSCGYFLLFFAPCVALYVLFEIATRRLWLDLRMWIAMVITAIVVAAATYPFLWPYLELRRLGFPARSYTEVESFAANVYSYWTAPAESRLWGRVIRAFPKAEGDLFPTITALIFALVGLVAGVRAAWRRSHGPAAAHPVLNAFVVVVAIGCALYTFFLLIILSGHGFADAGPLQLTVRSPVRNLQILLVALMVLMGTSPRARSFAANWLGSVVGIAVVLTLLTFILSLGPQIQTMGRALQGTTPYAFLYWHVRGFDGLRVPARYGMLVMLFLAIVAAFGVAEIEKGAGLLFQLLRPGWRNLKKEPGPFFVIGLGLLVVAESFAAPIVINGTSPESGFATPPPQVFTGERVPPVYSYLRSLPEHTIVVEFPFGVISYELRYVFYSAVHWHPLVNGYSGTFPLSYALRAAVLRHPTDEPEDSWDSLIEAGATHAVVHESYFVDGQGQAVSKWLADHGARSVGNFGTDKLFVIP